MAKSLNDILKRYSDALSGKRSSTVSALTTGDNPGVDYADKMKDARDFIAQHSVEKFDDRVGNGDDVYNASNVKKAEMERHGHEPKPKDIKVYKRNQQVGQPENKLKEEAEELDEAKCNMTEAGKMCETHGMKACPKEGTDSASDKEPRYNGKKKEGKQLITDKKIQEMATSQNQAISARIALKHKKEGTMPPKGTASRSMMGMSAKQLKDYTKAEPGAPKKVEESISNQRSSRSTASEKAREKIMNGIERRKMEKMKEQAAPAETVIKMPSGAVGDTGRV